MPDAADFHLFVSYARADNVNGWVTTLVEKLMEQFTADGAPEPLRPFFDKDAIRGGDDWESRILTSLRQSRAFLAILSPNYFASDWCRREWAWWTRHEMHRHCIRDGAAPIYFITVDGFPAPKSSEDIAAWIVAQNLRPGDPAAQDMPDIARAVKRFQPRQAYDLRAFDDKALAALAEQSLKDKLESLSKQVREVLDRAERAQRSPTDLPAYNPAFTGRVEDLIALRRDLALGAAGITAVVHGLGGIGKTELALAYAHAYGHEYPGGRFMVPCAGVVDWRGALDRFADLHGWTFEDKVKMNADLHLTLLINKLHEFAEQRGRCLLLFDNVDSPDLLRPGKIAQLRICDDRFHLLFTTRLPQPPNAGETGNLHWRALDSLPQEDAVTLLETIVHACPEAERPNLTELARELGGFTIAVELTGRYLASNPADPPSALLARLRTAPLPELGKEAQITGPDLYQHWNEARLDFILGQTLATLAPEDIRALEYAAQLAPDAVPLDWVRQLLAADFSDFAKDKGSAAAEKWTQLVEKLSSLRLLMRKKKPVEPDQPPSKNDVTATDPTALATIHRLVQEVLRKHCGAAAEERRQAAGKVIKSTCEFIREHWHKPEHRWLFPVVENGADAWLTRAERGEKCLAWDAGFVVNHACGVLHHIAAWNRAEPLLQRTRVLVENELGPESPELATTLHRLACLLLVTNRVTEAERLCQRALDIFEKKLGQEHPDVACTLNSLAEILRAANRLAEAEPLMRRALAIAETSFGPEHPVVAVPINTLALLLYDTNRLAEAEPLMHRALSIDEKCFGPEHPNVARDLNSLANLLQVTNRLAEAEPLYRRALAIDERSSGPEHPTVAIRLTNLAGLLRATDRLMAAEPLYRRALCIDEKSYGPEHPNVARAINNLAALLKATNRLAEAEPLYRRAIDIGEKYLPSEHPDLAVWLNNLALLLKATNRPTEAEPMLRRVLIIAAKFTSVTGHEHPHLQRFAGSYHGLLIESGLPRDQAMERLRSAMAEGGLRMG